MTAVDAEGRCTHWDGADDVLWLRLACCSRFYSCRACHDEAADHPALIWPPNSHAVALCCGRCGEAFTVAAYLAAPDACPACQMPFNPACQAHHDQYFSPA